ncbi:MAG: FAD-dependent oxidoreductase, partial [Alphaproteobacteria bacterium]|nr:FAD-dependent oxidoreductase [Alphaproteobacteria bacterium]
MGRRGSAMPPSATASPDVLVIGSGAAGLTCAFVAAELGLSVRVVEKAPVIGGTTAYSEGMIWVPASARALAAGVADTKDAALDYMRRVTGHLFDEARARAMLDAGPEMLAFVEGRSHARFDLALGSCDYLSELPGACRGGRAFDPASFDGRKLGSEFKRLRRPLPTTTIFGGMMIPGEDFGHAFKVLRSARSTARMARRFARYAMDRAMGWGRGTRLGGGNALVAALVLSLRERGIAVETDT